LCVGSMDVKVLCWGSVMVREREDWRRRGGEEEERAGTYMHITFSISRHTPDTHQRLFGLRRTLTSRYPHWPGLRLWVWHLCGYIVFPAEFGEAGSEAFEVWVDEGGGGCVHVRVGVRAGVGFGGWTDE
jgi:hypothetical protein